LTSGRHSLAGNALLLTRVLKPYMPRNPLALCLLLTLASIFNVSPRVSGQSEPAVIRADVKQVLVPVVVTDKKGHHVLGLKVNDFEVSEDGVPQKIIAFNNSSDSLAATEPAPTIATPSGPKTASVVRVAPPPTPKRTYLVCVDTMHSAFSNFARVSGALKKFFAQEQGEDSQYALVALGRKVRVVQDSTRDSAKILEAVGSKQFQKMIQDSEAINMVRDAQNFRNQMKDDYCKHCACEAFGTRTDSPGCAGAAGRVQGTLLGVGQRTEFLDLDFLRGLNELVKATASMPTMRTIILLSDGFNRYPGRELYAIMDGFGPSTNRMLQFNPGDAEPPLQKVLKLAVQYNVKFYTIDSRGLYAAASLGSSSFDASNGAVIPEKVDQNQMTTAQENTDALYQLAHETGGAFFENDNDLFKGIQRAFADSREYYLLAYSPTNKAADGTFRKIAVEVKGRKLLVNAKAGYWATN
jgi:VWFA-related protein